MNGPRLCRRPAAGRFERAGAGRFERHMKSRGLLRLVFNKAAVQFASNGLQSNACSVIARSSRICESQRTGLINYESNTKR
jgi:hypothetical protein